MSTRPRVPPFTESFSVAAPWMGVHRQRRPAPPKGWYLPDLADGQAELDSFDFVEYRSEWCHPKLTEVAEGASTG